MMKVTETESRIMEKHQNRTSTHGHFRVCSSLLLKNEYTVTIVAKDHVNAEVTDSEGTTSCFKNLYTQKPIWEIRIIKLEARVIFEKREKLIENLVLSPLVCFRISANPQMNNHRKKDTLPVFKMAAIDGNSRTSKAPLYNSKTKLKSIKEQNPHIKTMITIMKNRKGGNKRIQKLWKIKLFIR